MCCVAAACKCSNIGSLVVAVLYCVQVWLDDKENVVFFVGNKSSCLEKHL